MRSFSSLFAFLLPIVLLTSGVARAQTPEAKSMAALRIGSDAPVVDGRLDDELWLRARFFDDFLQKDPVERGAASERTEIAFAYDDEALYVAARMHMGSTADLHAAVTRRDKVGVTDRIIVSLDTYRDRRTAYSFSVTAAGARTDYYHGTDSEYDRDYSFDPVWETSTHVDSAGWTAEFRIPFSQLRFKDAEEQIWGLNINRYMPGRNEDIYWVVVPKQGTGWSSQMGELRGISGVRPSMRAELLPYVSSGAAVRDRIDADNPYDEKVDLDARAGIDAKLGLGPNLTLDLTVNPDFGQIEADPASVNLSAFETVFDEKRPFFVEGASLFSFQGGGLFYSRRIGAPPHGRADGQFVRIPDATRIAGAAKLTGQLSSGLGLGAIGAITPDEYALVFDPDTREEHRVKVEPVTWYGVGRAEQSFGSGSTVGMMITGVHRELPEDDPLRYVLSEGAMTGGVDWDLRFASGEYRLTGAVMGSRVQGDSNAIAAVQRSSAHYFQRPDADYVEYDPARTSLAGYAGMLRLNRISGKHWLFGVEGSVVSPELEINDVGQFNSADNLAVSGTLTYRETEPGAVVRSWSLLLRGGSAWNFGGVRQSTDVAVDGELTWANYLSSYLSISSRDNGLSDDLTRGGPMMDKTDVLYEIWAGMWSDWADRTRWSWNLGYINRADGGNYLDANATIEADIGDRFAGSVRLGYNRGITMQQYLFAEPNGPAETYGTRYVFSELDYSEVSARFRLNYAVTPDLSIEVYAEPFTANGDYRRFGELASAGTDVEGTGKVRWYDGSISRDDTTGTYSATTDTGPVEFGDPDFTFDSFRSNLVVRWEWLPGSTFFFVWQQDRSDVTSITRKTNPGDLISTFRLPGDNFLAVKVSYWLPIGGLL